jgi:hypothetical protein
VNLLSEGRSRYYVWTLFPYLNFVAWVHAGYSAGTKEYIAPAIIYSVPFWIAAFFGNVDIEVDYYNEISGWTAGMAFVLWLIGGVHLAIRKRMIDRKIDEHRAMVRRLIESSGL